MLLTRIAISTAKNGGWRYNYGNMFYVMLVQQYTGGAAYGSETFQKLMTEAKKYIGMPYVFGGSTPQTSFDCSGFICWVYTQSRRMQSPANDGVWHLLALHTNLGFAGAAG